MPDSSQNPPIRALLLAILVIGTAFTPVIATAETTSGGTVATAPDTAGVVLSNATINGSTPSDIEIGYNATQYIENGTVSQDDLWLVVRWAGNTQRLNLSTQTGTPTVTIPANDLAGGEHFVTAYLLNNTSNRLVSYQSAYETTAVTAQTNTTITDSSVSATDVNTSETFYVNATLENTASTPENFTIAAYDSTDRARATTTVALAANETRTVSLPLSIAYNTTLDLRVNNESTLPTVTIGSETSTGGGSSPIAVESASLTEREVLASDGFTASVTLNNTGSTSASKTISIAAHGTVNFSAQASNTTSVTVPAGETKTVTLNLSVPAPDKYTVTLPGGATTTGWALTTGTHIVLTNVGTNITAVVNEPTFLGATAYNLGTENGTENQTVVWNGQVLDDWNQTVNSTELKAVNFQVTFPEPVANGTVQIGDHTPALTVRQPVVTQQTVSCIAGPCPTETVTADLGLDGNMLQGSLDVENAPTLADAGVTTDTRFRLNVTVQNFSAPMLIATGHNVTWTRTPLNDTHTRYIVNITASEFDYLDGARLGSWPTGTADTATYHRNATVDIAFDPMDQYPVSSSRIATLNGTVIATDAQMFGTPQFYPGGASQSPKLSLLVAGPHYQPDGTINNGYYEAFLPNSLLASWNVSNGSELQAAYKNSGANLSTENVSGGLYVDIPIHYSQGTVKITPDTTNDGTTDDSGTTDESTDSDSTAPSDSTGETTTDDSTSPDTASDSNDSLSDNTTETTTSQSTTTTTEPTPTTTVPPTTTVNSETTAPTTTTTAPTPDDSTATASTRTTSTATESSPTPDGTTGTATPGFTGAVAVLAVLAVTLLVHRTS